VGSVEKLVLKNVENLIIIGMKGLIVGVCFVILNFLLEQNGIRNFVILNVNKNGHIYDG
jgi:hypothetical protein